MKENKRPDDSAAMNDDAGGSGYGKPPKQSQFKPGESGNPRGRPKGALNKPAPVHVLADIIEQEGFRIMKVKEAGKETSMPTARVIARKLNLKAANGDTRAAKIALNNLAEAQQIRAKQKAEFFKLAVDYKQYWQMQFEKFGSSTRLPPGAPHPDTILLNFHTQEVTCISMTPEEDELFLLGHDRLSYFQTALVNIANTLVESGDSPDLADDLHRAIQQVARNTRLLGMPWTDDYKGSYDYDRIQELLKIVEKKLKASGRL